MTPKAFGKRQWRLTLGSAIKGRGNLAGVENSSWGASRQSQNSEAGEALESEEEEWSRGE